MQYPPSKLPDIGTTIFTVMSQLAAEHRAINLSQGFPDFDGPTPLLEAVGKHVMAGANQYPPMTGIAPLRQAISEKVSRLYGAKVDPELEVTITSGATEALYAAIGSVVRQGDEVIVFDPAFDSYDPAIRLNGGVPVHLTLSAPDFKIDWKQLAEAINPRTRLIIINTPHNPTGTVLEQQDLERLADLLEGTDTLLISDDVYEHILFDQRPHLSFTGHARLFERSFVVSSFGKTYHATGWKVGYCVAPAALSAEFRKVHQFLTFTTATPLQYALADIMAEDPGHTDRLPGFYQQKRDLFNSLMADSRFSFIPTQGSYFQLADYSAISDMDDMDFCRYLTEEVGVAAIPLSVFYQNPPQQRLIRFCFAKSDDTLRAACERLVKL